MSETSAEPTGGGFVNDAAPRGDADAEEVRGEDSLAGIHARRPSLVRLAYRFLWNLDDAEDAVQNALLLAARKLDQVSDRNRLWSWVRRIVIRQCHESRRMRERQGRRDAAAQDQARGAAGVSPDHAELDEATETVRRLIYTLPERQRTALVLRHLEGLSYGEVATLMETSESTARVQVRAAREALRRALGPHRPES